MYVDCTNEDSKLRRRKEERVSVHGVVRINTGVRVSAPRQGCAKTGGNATVQLYGRIHTVRSRHVTRSVTIDILNTYI